MAKDSGQIDNRLKNDMPVQLLSPNVAIRPITLMFLSRTLVHVCFSENFLSYNGSSSNDVT